MEIIMRCEWRDHCHRSPSRVINQQIARVLAGCAASEETESLANGEQLKACYACSGAQPGLSLNADWL